MTALVDIVFRSDALSDFQHPTAWLLDWAGGYGKSRTGETVDPQSALRLDAYYDCVRVISEDVGKLPLKVYRRAGRQKTEARDHPLWSVLHISPSPLIGSMAFRETLTAWALGWGNGYAHVLRNGAGKIAQLNPIHPSRGGPRLSETGALYYEFTDAQKQRQRFQPEDILHIHGLGDDGLQGYSPAALHRDCIALGLAAENFAATFYGSGGSIRGAIKFPAGKKLPPEQQEAFRRQWEAGYGGENPENRWKTALLQDGQDWVRIGISPEDAQYVEGAELTVEKICRLFRVPPHKIQHLKRSSYATVEAQNIEYVVDCLSAWVKRWEEEFSRKLFAGEQDVFAEMALQGLLRGDSAARSQYFSTLFNIGSLSQNDIREFENLNPIEGGDTYYVPSNLTRSQDAAAGLVSSSVRTAAMLGGREGPEEPEEEEPEENEAELEEEARAESAMVMLEPMVKDTARRILARAEKAVLHAMQRGHEPNGCARQSMEEALHAQADMSERNLLPLCHSVGAGPSLARGIVEDFESRGQSWIVDMLIHPAGVHVAWAEAHEAEIAALISAALERVFV